MTHFKMGYGSKQIALKRNENGQEISFKMSTVYNNQKKRKSKHLWDFILTIPPQPQSKWQRSVNPSPPKKSLKQILVTMWTQGTLNHFSWNFKLVCLFWKSVWRTKQNKPTLWPAIPLLRNMPEWLQILLHIDLPTHVHFHSNLNS